MGARGVVLSGTGLKTDLGEGRSSRVGVAVSTFSTIILSPLET